MKNYCYTRSLNSLTPALPGVTFSLAVDTTKKLAKPRNPRYTVREGCGDAALRKSCPNKFFAFSDSSNSI
jgi:hypothetical protein